MLPHGFRLPPVDYLIPLVLGVALAVYFLLRTKPTVETSTVVGLLPWVGLGGVLRVGHRVEVFPPSVEPLFGTPAVYLTTFVAAAAVWLLSLRYDRSDTVLGGVGLLVIAPAISSLYLLRDTVHTAAPLAGVVATAALTAGVWLGISRLQPDAAETTGYVGLAVVLGHVLDGVSTAVGIDLLGFNEETPLSRVVIGIGYHLTPSFGGTWLFVLLKVAVAVGVVVGFTEYVDERPSEGRLILAVVAALGLGPGIHNILFFTVSPA
ncbi:MAG: DUF63 family protein [Halobacteria archaeon]|nr:DUF63 family protein [Halobacteria archaeon]